MKDREAVKKSGKKKIFIALTILVPLFAVAIIMSTYGMVKNYKTSLYENVDETMLDRLFRETMCCIGIFMKRSEEKTCSIRTSI